MLEKGSLDGQRIWKRVLAAVKEIQRQEPAIMQRARAPTEDGRPEAPAGMFQFGGGFSL